MINYDLFKEIELYAKRHFESSIHLYKRRNQNTNKIFNDILRGKIAEWNCYFQMKKEQFILNEPDMKIYTENKSYDADLIVTGKRNKLYVIPNHIHVKSVSKDTAKNFGVSFLIEKNDGIVYRPLDNHWFCVMVEESLLVYERYAWIKSTEVKYESPKMNLPSKHAVYLREKMTK